MPKLNFAQLKLITQVCQVLFHFNWCFMTCMCWNCFSISHNKLMMILMHHLFKSKWNSQNTHTEQQTWGQIRFFNYKYKYASEFIQIQNTNTASWNHSNTNTVNQIQLQHILFGWCGLSWALKRPFHMKLKFLKFIREIHHNYMHIQTTNIKKYIHDHLQFKN